MRGEAWAAVAVLLLCAAPVSARKMKEGNFSEEMNKADLVCVATVESVRDTGLRDTVHGMHYVQPITFPVKEATLKVLLRLKAESPVPDTVRLLYKAEDSGSPREDGPGLLDLRARQSVLLALSWDKSQQAYRLTAADPDPDQAAIFVSPRVTVAPDLPLAEAARSVVWQTVTDEEFAPHLRGWALLRYPEVRFPGVARGAFAVPGALQFSEEELTFLRRSARSADWSLANAAIAVLLNYAGDVETLQDVVLGAKVARNTRLMALNYLLQGAMRDKVHLPWADLLNDKDPKFLTGYLDEYQFFHEKVPPQERPAFAQKALQLLQSSDTDEVTAAVKTLITQDRKQHADAVLRRMEAGDAGMLSSISLALSGVLNVRDCPPLYGPNVDYEKVRRFWQERLRQPSSNQ